MTNNAYRPWALGVSLGVMACVSLWATTPGMQGQSAPRRTPQRRAAPQPAPVPPTPPRPAPAPADWLVWGGPNRDFHSSVTGLLPSWPASGPKKRWTRALGEGFSAPAIEGSRLYTMYSTSTGEVVVALDTRTGATIWEHAYSTNFSQGANDVGRGPYAMPQVIGNRIVSVGGTGKLYSLDKQTGKFLPVKSQDLK